MMKSRFQIFVRLKWNHGVGQTQVSISMRYLKSGPLGGSEFFSMDNAACILFRATKLSVSVAFIGEGCVLTCSLIKHLHHGGRKWCLVWMCVVLGVQLIMY